MPDDTLPHPLPIMAIKALLWMLPCILIMSGFNTQGTTLETLLLLIVVTVAFGLAVFIGVLERYRTKRFRFTVLLAIGLFVFGVWYRELLSPDLLPLFTPYPNRVVLQTPSYVPDGLIQNYVCVWPDYSAINHEAFATSDSVAQVFDYYAKKPSPMFWDAPQKREAATATHASHNVCFIGSGGSKFKSANVLIWLDPEDLDSARIIAQYYSTAPKGMRVILLVRGYTSNDLP